MAKTVVGLFERYRDAQEAAQEMIDMGVSSRDISLIANDSRGEFKNIGAGMTDSPPGDFSTRDSTGGTKGAEGATAGAIGGGALGGVLGLLVGVGALAIPGIGPVLAAGPLAAAIGSGAAGAVAGAGIGAAGGGLLGGLAGLGIPDEDAGMYAEGVRRGGTLLTVQADDGMVDQVAQVFDRHGAVDLDERSAEWRKGGWKGFDASASPYTTQQVDTMATERRTAAPRRAAEGETVLPVVEEQLNVGKRQVERRGVRVHTTVEEKPVEEQVNLREERVRVERRPADRPADLAGGDVFREQDFELTETAEEPVVQKTARVVEEVVVDKDVRERTETVRDTVRRQDVRVDERGSETVGASGASRATFESFDWDFRTDFQGRRIDGGYTYDQYAPVYRYGYMLANDQRYAGRDWSAIEPEARTRWEERNPGTWEQFKDSVRYAWDRVRGRA